MQQPRTLYCACGAKLMIERPRDKTEDRYEYFTCSGRRRKTTNCTRSAILAERAEAEIERTYQRNSLTQTQAEHVRKVLNDVFDQLEGSSEDERKLLTAQRDKLEAERLKLVQAHDADAIPLDLLTSEQDRIRASLDQITTRLDNLTDTYAEARTGLDQLTELLVDLNDLYNKCEPAERRILNRALFTRITIDDEENATYSPDETTASVLAHTSIDAPAHVTAETKLPRHQAGQVSIFSSYVELRGLEPLTPCMPCRCATSCAIAPCFRRNFTTLPSLPVYPDFSSGSPCGGVCVSGSPRQRLDHPRQDARARANQREASQPTRVAASSPAPGAAPAGACGSCTSMAGLSPQRRSSA